MPTGPAPTADEIAETIRSLIDRVSDAKLSQEMARRGHEVVEIVAETGAGVGDRASEAWRESRPLRRQAIKRAAQASRDAARWSNRTWRSSLRPMLRDIWKRRTVAIAAAGAAVPAAQELVDSTAVRLGLREEEEHRHWGAFFLGLLIGAAAGAIAALLTAPKRGEEMRRELAVRADEVRNELAVRADEVRNELAARAKDADWVPIFQSDQPTNGHGTEAVGDPSGSVQEAAATGASAGEEAASETAEAINEAYDTVDRETQS